ALVLRVRRTKQLVDSLVGDVDRQRLPWIVRLELGKEVVGRSDEAPVERSADAVAVARGLTRLVIVLEDYFVLRRFLADVEVVVVAGAHAVNVESLERGDEADGLGPLLLVQRNLRLHRDRRTLRRSPL